MIVFEGCNGEWARECYLPLLAGEAAKGAIELWAVDIEDSIKLSTSEVRRDWQLARSRNKAYYLNKNKDIQYYTRLSGANYVFIVTPDHSHCQIAEFWLEHLAPGGKIFIEKPLDASWEQAEELGKKIGGRDIVYGFDHYLAGAYPFLQNKASYLGEIGEIRQIECNILEPDPIPQHRVETLGTGMIFDLFCHVLALVWATANQNLTCSAAKLPEVELEVKAARYADCPISGETFASIKFMVNPNMEVSSAVGKCVGTSDEKFMILHGSNGNIKLDFVEDKFYILNSQGSVRERGGLDSRHVESFLEGVLARKETPLSVPGVLSFDTAFGILKVLHKAKTLIGNKLPEYRCKDSIDTILEILRKGELQ